jgi:hypothetical protein
MNRHVGAGLGMLTGAILFFCVSGLIYAAGYLTVQLSAEDNNPGIIKFINSARQDMAESGFDRVAAKFEPASTLYYQAADILGLLYHNPLLQSRLATYPYFLSLGERPEFQEIANDKEYNDLIFGKAPVTQIIAHPRTQSLLGNQEALTYLKGTDLNDLREYLRSGKSVKFDDQEILGVWHLDKEAVVTFIRKAKPDIKARELRMVRQAFDMVPPIVLVATPENKVIVKSGSAAQPGDQPPADPSSPDAAPGPGQRPPAAALPPGSAAPPIPKFAGEGSWSEEAGHYVVALNDPAGRQVKGNASIKADEMVLSIGGADLIFAKQ